MMEMRNAHKILAGKTKEKKSFGRREREKLILT
jgi:hypothetical protein